MYSSKKKKQPLKRQHLHTSKANYNPFMMYDTRYLEHLHQQAKLRNSRDTLLMKLKDYKESIQRVNYQNEIDRLRNELERPNLSDNTREQMRNRIDQLKRLKFT